MRYALNSSFLHKLITSIALKILKNLKLKIKKAVWCGASLDITYLFVGGVRLRKSWYVWLCLLRAHARLRTEIYEISA
jgi:hypothetical protein